MFVKLLAFVYFYWMYFFVVRRNRSVCGQYSCNLAFPKEGIVPDKDLTVSTGSETVTF